MEIRIDPDCCIGSGNCAHYAPKTFDVGDDMIAHVIDPNGDPIDRVRLAEQGCPTNAVTVVEQ